MKLADAVEFSPSEARMAFQVPILEDEEGRNQAHRDIDEERPAPREVLGEPSAK